MKVSLITTFRNEEEGIEGFVDSIFSQTRLPDEIVMVDGGSEDRTVRLVERYRDRNVPVRLLIEAGCNISEGRNRAIREAKHEIIAVSDVGCVLDPEWLRELVEPMERDDTIGVVAGSYRVDAVGIWERVTSSYLMPFPGRISREMPSGRSTGFRRRAWEDAGGYPEWLHHAEDSYFAAELQRKGYRFHFSPRAVVRWRPRGGPVSFFRQYFRYAVGDARGGLSRRHYRIKILIYGFGTILALAGSFAPLASLAALYLALIMTRYWFRGKDRSLVLFLPPLVALHDVAQIAGYIAGSLSDHRGEKEKIEGKRNR